MALEHIGRLVPESLKVDPEEAKRIAEGCRMNIKAAKLLKSLDYDVPRTKRWIAANQPSENMLEAMRRVHREYFKKA